MLNKKPCIPMSRALIKRTMHCTSPTSGGDAQESPLHGFFEFSHKSSCAHACYSLPHNPEFLVSDSLRRSNAIGKYDCVIVWT